MWRKLGYSLLLAGAIFNTPASAMTYTLAPQMRIDYDLLPNVSIEVINLAPWTIRAKCTFTLQDPSDDISIEMLNSTGKINDQPVAKGDTIILTIHPQDKMVISADKGTKVKLTNLGQSIVKTSCSTY
ncbi:hypothetical protein [Legionella fairfieldensis]|uniref:hypothetical protein n=1 Tax=Legionella fairfieldensis TaxID=45064 RepID=UPI00048C7D8F|nr:hypothetical protein [Legionella fairfieldensis]